MPRQSSGTYTAPATTAAVASGVVDTNAFNTLVADIGAELTNSVDSLGRNGMLAPLNMGGFLINNVGTASSNTDAINQSFLVGQAQPGIPLVGSIGGTADALTASFSPSFGAATNGMRVLVRALYANLTPNPSFNASETWPFPIVKGMSTVLTPSDITPGQWLELLFDGTINSWVLLNPGSGFGYYGVYAPGRIKQFATGWAPYGWLECNGGAVSRATYARLFAAIGTAFGAGDGSTTFNIPWSLGYFLRGYDHGAGVDPGRAFGAYQADQFQNHIHTFPITSPANIIYSASSTPCFQASGLLNTSTNASGNAGAETRGKNVAVMTCIKY